MSAQQISPKTRAWQGARAGGLAKKTLSPDQGSSQKLPGQRAAETGGGGGRERGIRSPWAKGDLLHVGLAGTRAQLLSRALCLGTSGRDEIPVRKGRGRGGSSPRPGPPSCHLHPCPCRLHGAPLNPHPKTPVGLPTGSPHPTLPAEPGLLPQRIEGEPPLRGCTRCP